MDTKITIKIQCIECKHNFEVKVEPEDYEKYKNGEFVQHAFPYLSEEARELFISQLCPHCWDKLFAEDTDEDIDFTNIIRRKFKKVVHN